MNISIRAKAILLLVLLMVLPLLVAGALGILYYQGIIKGNIWDDNLAQAKAISGMTEQYLRLSSNYLESIATRPSVIDAIEADNRTFLNSTVLYAQNKSDFYQLYITNSNGTIISCYPDVSICGKDESNHPFVKDALMGARSQVNYLRNDEDRRPTIFLSAPIVGRNGTTLGVIVGQLDPNKYRDTLLATQVKNRQYIYLVNNSGNIIVHSKQTYMDNMTNLSSVPGVQNVLLGTEGVIEQYNPIEHDDRLAAWSPVKTIGWGVVVALPVEIAYRPIYESTWTFLAMLIGTAALSILIAIFIGNNIVEPLTSITTATKKMTNGGDYLQFLPVRRNDEFGELARSFEEMSRRIIDSKNKLAEERNRAELYVDIMGHDINNLNQSALLNLELLESDPDIKEEQRKMVESALISVEGSAEIIDNVRKIQLINKGDLPVEPEDIDVMISQCIESAPRPAGRNIQFKYAPGQGRLVKGTPLLKEAFCNLIYNAIKHSEGDVDIQVDISERMQGEKKYYDISIADNGPGISDELKGKLFSRFQRGETKAHGRGLGLYITRMLVEHVGGTVRVEDRVPGDYRKGARFVVTLPASGGEKHG